MSGRVSAHERNRLDIALDRMRRERLTPEQERVLRLIKSGELQKADGQHEGFVFAHGHSIKPATLLRLERLGRIKLVVLKDTASVYRGYMFGRNGGTRTYTMLSYLAQPAPSTPPETDGGGK